MALSSRLRGLFWVGAAMLTSKPAEQIFEYQGAAIFRAKQP